MWVFFSFIAHENLKIVEFSGQMSDLFTKIQRQVALARLNHKFQTYPEIPDFLNRSRALNENVYRLNKLIARKQTTNFK